jgi:hypothetical protein
VHHKFTGLDAAVAIPPWHPLKITLN